MPSSSSTGKISASGCSPPQRVFALQRRHGLHGVRTADGLDPGFGKSEMPNLSRGDQILHGPRHIFDWHVRVEDGADRRGRSHRSADVGAMRQRLA